MSVVRIDILLFFSNSLNHAWNMPVITYIYRHFYVCMLILFTLSLLLVPIIDGNSWAVIYCIFSVEHVIAKTRPVYVDSFLSLSVIGIVLIIVSCTSSLLCILSVRMYCLFSSVQIFSCWKFYLYQQFNYNSNFTLEIYKKLLRTHNEVNDAKAMPLPSNSSEQIIICIC